MPRQRERREHSTARRLLAGLRVTPHDEALLAVVRPLLAEAGSESELAYRLWRRGLELTLAEAASVGSALPPGTSEAQVAVLVAQRLLLCIPLLRRTGLVGLLGLDAPPHTDESLPARSPLPLASGEGSIDASAASAISGLGGNDFL